LLIIDDVGETRRQHRQQRIKHDQPGDDEKDIQRHPPNRYGPGSTLRLLLAFLKNPNFHGYSPRISSTAVACNKRILITLAHNSTSSMIVPVAAAIPKF